MDQPRRGWVPLPKRAKHLGVHVREILPRPDIAQDFCSEDKRGRSYAGSSQGFDWGKLGRAARWNITGNGDSDHGEERCPHVVVPIRGDREVISKKQATDSKGN